MTSPDERQKGLTLRSFVVCIVALFVMGMWVEYVEKYCTYGGPLAENWPPNSAVGVILGVMGISWLLYRLRHSLRLVSRELVVIYAALLVASPMMTQGMWGRFFGLLAAIPHYEDFKSYENLPPQLWPHGPNLLKNAQFEKNLDGYTHTGDGKLGWETVSRGAKGQWKCPVLSNETESMRSALEFSVPRTDGAGHEVLVPGERFLFSMLVKTKDLQKGSSYSVTFRADGGTPRTAIVQTMSTKPSFANPAGFQRVGVCPISVPGDLKDTMTFSVGIVGPGALALQDLEFMNVEAVEGLYAGRRVVSESRLSELGPDERDFTVVKPDRMLSLRGIRYVVTGFIPWRQWVMPAVAWTLLIGGLFIGFLGFNLLMARQWIESERFSFPLNILPKNLFHEVDDGEGGVIQPIFRSRAMWIGFAIVLPLAILKGLHFYNPAVPAPVFDAVNFSTYFDSPLAKAYFQDISIGGSIGMGISMMVLAIGLLIETNILFSMWATFLLFQLWNLFGPLFNFSRVPGYPWRHQQGMGAFIAFAAVALFVGRRHLKDVFSRVFRRFRPDKPSPIEVDVNLYRLALVFVVTSFALLALWGIWTEMGMFASLLFFGYMLVLGFATSKLRAECGAPFSYITPYFGMQFVAAMGGFAIFGSKGMLVATIASGFMTTSSFLLIAPVQVEMLEMGRHFNIRRRDVGVGLSLGLLGGLFLGGFTVLCWAYGMGANNFETAWPYEQNWYYTAYRTGELNADRAFEAGTLNSIPENKPLNFSKNVDAKGLGVGAVFTVIIAVLRSNFMWFPLHPIGYVVASTHFMSGFFLISLLAWIVRVLVLRIGGARMIRSGLVPFCVGMVVASVVSLILFDVVGMYLRTLGVTNLYNKMP